MKKRIITLPQFSRRGRKGQEFACLVVVVGESLDGGCAFVSEETLNFN